METIEVNTTGEWHLRAPYALIRTRTWQSYGWAPVQHVAQSYYLYFIAMNG